MEHINTVSGDKTHIFKCFHTAWLDTSIVPSSVAKQPKLAHMLGYCWLCFNITICYNSTSSWSTKTHWLCVHKSLIEGGKSVVCQHTVMCTIQPSTGQHQQFSRFFNTATTIIAKVEQE